MKKKLFSEIPYLEDGRIVLRKLEPEDADGLRELVNSPAVYRYLPTFLFEKKYEDVTEVIRRLYGECFEESMILGIFAREDEDWGFGRPTPADKWICRWSAEEEM